MSLAASSCTSDGVVVSCDSLLIPVKSVAPKLPATLHNEYEGKVVVAYAIDKSGHVQNPSIISAAWRPVGHGGKEPAGYNEALLTAVKRWRYPPQAHVCHKETGVEINFDPSLIGPGGQV